MRLLFVKEALSWPRASGHDVHCYYMMRALAGLGHRLALATVARPTPEALAGLLLERWESLDDPAVPGDGSAIGPHFSRLQERFRSYWGIDLERIRAVGRIARAFAADVVVVVGLNVLPYVGAVEGALRVWYAADEWAWHHLSQVRLGRPGAWANLRQALVKGLYERAYAPLLHRVWVVSEADRRAMRWVAGVQALDLLPNGVDGEHFTPRAVLEEERTCTFWGRLDFGPNVQALQWFCRRVWPGVRSIVADARLSIYGFEATPAVRALAGRDGITLTPDLPDLRDEIARHAVVVLPFVSGGGIKNKLLEAASMGKAIVCTPRTCHGLRGETGLPFIQARQPAEWIRAMTDLWADVGRRQQFGEEARRWVLTHHTWEAAARGAAAGLQASLRREPAGAGQPVRLMPATGAVRMDPGDRPR